MKYQSLLAASFAAVMCLVPLAEVSHAAAATAAAKKVQPVDADTEVNELLFGEAGNGFFLAGERKFMVTPKTVFYGKSGSKVALSSIRDGSTVKVAFHREADGNTLSAITVTVTKDPQ